MLGYLEVEGREEREPDFTVKQSVCVCVLRGCAFVCVLRGCACVCVLRGCACVCVLRGCACVCVLRGCACVCVLRGWGWGTEGGGIRGVAGPYLDCTRLYLRSTLIW